MNPGIAAISFAITFTAIVSTPLAYAQQPAEGELFTRIDPAKGIGKWYREEVMRRGFVSKHLSKMKKNHAATTERLMQSNQALLDVYRKTKDCWSIFRLSLGALAVGLAHGAGARVIEALKPTFDAFDEAVKRFLKDANSKGARASVAAALQTAESALADKVSAYFRKKLQEAQGFMNRKSCDIKLK
jgi:hypothetical protein